MPALIKGEKDKLKAENAFVELVNGACEGFDVFKDEDLDALAPGQALALNQVYLTLKAIHDGSIPGMSLKPELTQLDRVTFVDGVRFIANECDNAARNGLPEAHLRWVAHSLTATLAGERRIQGMAKVSERLDDYKATTGTWEFFAEPPKPEVDKSIADGPHGFKTAQAVEAEECAVARG